MASTADKKAPSVTVEQVRSVYSGKDGECCCGCKGKHYYASAHRAEAFRNRGYEIMDEDVSDRMVKKVVRLMSEHAQDVMDSGDFLELVVGTRLYLAYRTEAAQAAPRSV